MNKSIVEFDPTRRQILPASEAVVRFRRRDWERASAARERADLPAPVSRASFEEIVLEGASAFVTVGTESGLVGKRVVQFSVCTDAPLEIAPEAFAVVADNSIQAAASEALAVMATQRTRARQRAAVVVPAAPMWPAWVAAAVFVAAVAGWCWHVLHS